MMTHVVQMRGLVILA